MSLHPPHAMPHGRPILEQLLALNATWDADEARRAFMRGRVLVDGMPVYDPRAVANPKSRIAFAETREKYVSRGGTKLEGALEAFGLSPQGLVCLDVGCSTGGFTDCLLAHGAAKVYAVDVGYGVLDWLLRNHPRVVVLERTNAKEMTAELVPEKIAFATADLNHISLADVLPAVLPLLLPGAPLLALVKPQFEMPRRWTFEPGFEKGVITSGELLARVLRVTLSRYDAMGFYAAALSESEITGRKGNREFFALLYAGRLLNFPGGVVGSGGRSSG